jgi:energy-coupling factor transporter ATP-binding protein EcfA2
MFLKHIDISQVRSIDRIELDFTAVPTARPGARAALRQRTVLLGDNGCGKSTALQAIGLVLAGSKALPELLKEPAQWVRLGKKEGRIQAVLVTREGAEREISLTLRPEWNLRQTLAKNEAGLSAIDDALVDSAGNFFTLGYGAGRRPAIGAQAVSRGREGAPAPDRAAGLATLFSPSASLVAFEPWVMDMDRRGGRTASATAGNAALRAALKKLLPGLSLDGVDRKQRELRFKTVDGLLPFGQLSDAHQNMANWCADVLYRISGTFDGDKAPLKARGVLLIDELDLHLHPVWQRQLVDLITTVFPNLQLIASSHSPVVAQQMRKHELYVIERPGPKQGALARAVQGDPSQLTLSQILSPLFGIDTGDSARVAALRTKARAKGVRLSVVELDELAQLAPVDSLPPAMREQLMASAALTDAISRVSRSKGAPPELDLKKLRLKMGERIRSAALRAGVVS